MSCVRPWKTKPYIPQLTKTMHKDCSVNLIHIGNGFSFHATWRRCKTRGPLRTILIFRLEFLCVARVRFCIPNYLWTSKGQGITGPLVHRSLGSKGIIWRQYYPPSWGFLKKHHVNLIQGPNSWATRMGNYQIRNYCSK